MASYSLGERLATKVADNLCKDMGVEEDNNNTPMTKIDRMV